MAFSTLEAKAEVARTAADVERDLISLVRPWVHTFSRDVYTFHYGPRPAGETAFRPAVDAGVAAAYSRVVYKTVHQPNVRLSPMKYSDWFGQGLYVAVDPIISSNYADPEGGLEGGDSASPWILDQITLPKGSRYWDAKAGERVDIPGPLRRELRRDYGCKAKNLYDLIQIVKDRDLKCRRFVRAVIEGLDIDAIGYAWGTANGFEKYFCPSSRNMAFYITRKEPFTADLVRRFTSTLPPGGQDEASENRLMIQSIFSFTAQARIYRWPELHPMRNFPKAKEWAHEHLFSCGGYAEDRDYAEPAAP